MISTSRESISRTLNQLKRDHLLETNRDGIRKCERRENGC
ncbi:MAG: helix-turn-helix domain-containing protein [Novibacillus thermophilus]